MRNETFSLPDSNRVNTAANGRGSQASRKISPFIQLTVARSRRALRITLQPMPRRPLFAAEQAALAAVRAAELAAWESSGGDALRRMSVLEGEDVAPLSLATTR